MEREGREGEGRGGMEKGKGGMGKGREGMKEKRGGEGGRGRDGKEGREGCPLSEILNTPLITSSVLVLMLLISHSEV